MLRSSSPLLLLVQVVLAAVAGALAAGFLVMTLAERAPAEREPAPERQVSNDAPPDAWMQSTLEQLRDENRALRARLTALEQRPAPAAREPAGDFVSRAAFTAFEQEVRAWMVTEPAIAAPLDLSEAPELHDEVAAALKTIRKDEAVEKAMKANDAQTEKLEERVGKVAEWLTLNTYQSDEVREILRAKDAREREIIESWKRGDDDEALARLKHENAVTLFGEFERVLGPDQLAKLEERFPRPDEKR